MNDGEEKRQNRRRTENRGMRHSLDLLVPIRQLNSNGGFAEGVTSCFSKRYRAKEKRVKYHKIKEEER